MKNNLIKCSDKKGGAFVNNIEQDTLARDSRKLKGIMVALYALENDIYNGNIASDLDKTMELFGDQISAIAKDIDELLEIDSPNPDN